MGQVWQEDEEAMGQGEGYRGKEGGGSRTGCPLGAAARSLEESLALACSAGRKVVN